MHIDFTVAYGDSPQQGFLGIPQMGSQFKGDDSRIVHCHRWHCIIHCLISDQCSSDIPNCHETKPLQLEMVTATDDGYVV